MKSKPQPRRVRKCDWQNNLDHLRRLRPAPVAKAISDDIERINREQQEIALGAILALLTKIGELEANPRQGIDWGRIAANHMKARFEADKALQDYVASFDAHRTKLREIMDCARRDIRGTIYFVGEDWRKLEETAHG